MKYLKAKINHHQTRLKFKDGPEAHTISIFFKNDKTLESIITPTTEDGKDITTDFEGKNYNELQCDYEDVRKNEGAEYDDFSFDDELNRITIKAFEEYNSKQKEQLIRAGF